MDSNNNSHHNVTYAENDQNDLPKKLFSRLNTYWGKRKSLS